MGSPLRLGRIHGCYKEVQSSIKMSPKAYVPLAPMASCKLLCLPHVLASSLRGHLSPMSTVLALGHLLWIVYWRLSSFAVEHPAANLSAHSFVSTLALPFGLCDGHYSPSWTSFHKTSFHQDRRLVDLPGWTWGWWLPMWTSATMGMTLTSSS